MERLFTIFLADTSLVTEAVRPIISKISGESVCISFRYVMRCGGVRSTYIFVNKYDVSVVADISSDNRSSGRKTVISCIHYQHEPLIIHNVLTLQKDHASCM